MCPDKAKGQEGVAQNRLNSLSKLFTKMCQRSNAKISGQHSKSLFHTRCTNSKTIRYKVMFGLWIRNGWNENIMNEINDMKVLWMSRMRLLCLFVIKNDDGIENNLIVLNENALNLFYLIKIIFIFYLNKKFSKNFKKWKKKIQTGQCRSKSPANQCF